LQNIFDRAKKEANTRRERFASWWTVRFASFAKGTPPVRVGHQVGGSSGVARLLKGFQPSRDSVVSHLHLSPAAGSPFVGLVFPVSAMFSSCGRNQKPLNLDEASFQKKRELSPWENFY